MLPSYFLSLKLDFCHVFFSLNIFIPSLTYSVCVCERVSMICLLESKTCNLSLFFNVSNIQHCLNDL